MISLDISTEPDSKWNDRLLGTDTGTIYHTKEFATTMKELGNDPYFIYFVNKNGEIIGQMLGLLQSRFRDNDKLFSIKSNMPFIKKKFFSWTYGPVFFDRQYVNDICKTLLDTLHSKKYIVSGSNHPLDGKIFHHLKSPLKNIEWGTFIIDLRQNKEEAWKKLDKHSAQKNVERALKKNVYVKNMNRSDLKYYSEIRKESRAVSINILEKRWDKLSPIGWTGFLAFKNEKPIGGIMLSFFNNYINEWGVARTKDDTLEKNYAQDLLKWKIIEWGIDNRKKFFDLTGVNPKPKNKKETGIFKYKKKWGGSFTSYDIIKS